MAFHRRDKYHILIRILHWLMAIMILSLIAVGWYMEGLPKEAAGRGDLYSLHKSFGVTILALLFIRIAIRLTKGAPDLPDSIPYIIRKAAHAVHYLIYILMFSVPLAGIMMSNMYGYPVKWFGYKLPFMFPENKELAYIAKESHGILAYALLALVAFHIAGAIKHRFFEKNPKNDVLNRML